MLTALTQITGDFRDGGRAARPMMGLRGRVLPTTGEDVRLRAEMDSGQILDRRNRHRRHAARASGGCRWIRARSRCRTCCARWSTRTAIVVGPGSLYTSTAAEPARRGRRRDDFRRERGAHLRREPDDGAGRDRRLHARRSPARHPAARRLRSLRLHPGQSPAAAGLARRAATRSRDRSPCSAIGRCAGPARQPSSKPISAVRRCSTAARSATNPSRSPPGSGP